MGYLTSVMIYNDHADLMRDDPKLGEGLWSAVNSWSCRDRDRYALQIGRHQSRVVSQGHADYPQIVMLWRNAAYAFSDHLDPRVTDEMIDFAIKELKDLKRFRASRVARGKD